MINMKKGKKIILLTAMGEQQVEIEQMTNMRTLSPHQAEGYTWH
jgi:hypothetical protein